MSTVQTTVTYEGKVVELGRGLRADYSTIHGFVFRFDIPHATKPPGNYHARDGVIRSRIIVTGDNVSISISVRVEGVFS